MSEKQTPEFNAAVQLITALTSLTLAFRRKVGDGAFKVTQSFNEHLGMKFCHQFKEKMSITGSGIHDINRVYHAWLDSTLVTHKLDTKVEGNKLVVTRVSPTTCAAMVVAKKKNLPLELVCRYVTQPIFQGIVKAVNPKAQYSAIEMGEHKCVETIEIM